jgi:hypothetical protein
MCLLVNASLRIATLAMRAIEMNDGMRRSFFSFTLIRSLLPRGAIVTYCRNFCWLFLRF